MKTMTTRAVALVGALAISLGAAACSKSEAPGAGASSAPSSATTTTAAPAPKAAEILAKAKENALSAKSGAFAGEIEESGTAMTIDFKGTADGSTADIGIEMGKEGKVRLISVPGSVYMQADQVFWKAQGAPAAVQKAGDKFVKAPAEAAKMADSLSLKNFLDQAFGALTADQLADTVEEESVNGVDCWVLYDKKGKTEGALYVSKDAHEVVRFTGSSASPGQLDFSRWNEDLGIKAPAAKDILDIS